MGSKAQLRFFPQATSLLPQGNRRAHEGEKTGQAATDTHSVYEFLLSDCLELRWAWTWRTSWPSIQATLYVQAKCLGSNLVKYIFIFTTRALDFLVLFPGLNTKALWFSWKGNCSSTPAWALTATVCPNPLPSLERTYKITANTSVGRFMERDVGAHHTSAYTVRGQLALLTSKSTPISDAAAGRVCFVLRCKARVSNW